MNKTPNKKKAETRGSTDGPALGRQPERINNGRVELKYDTERERRRSVLEEQTGWPWDKRELSHFYAPPTANPDEVRVWRANLENDIRLQFSEDDQIDTEALTTLVDVGLQRYREVSRILSVLYTVGGDTSGVLAHEKDARRTIKRLGLFREIDRAYGITPEPRKAVPPLLRPKLLEYAAIHGATVCTSEHPECAGCEIARFCGTRRAEILETYRRADRPKIVDLFCGAGGVSSGFDAAGYRTVCATDANPDACRTFSLNHPATPEGHVLIGDITSGNIIDRLIGIVGSNDIDVLVGGPPCQGFSKSGFSASRALRARRMHAGFGEEDDERNYLFEYMIEVASRICPNVVLMENVPGMDAKRGALPSFMRVAENMLRELGYSTAIWDIDAASFGVPQHRLRKFLVGSLATVPPALPEPDYIGRVRSMNNADDLLQPVTLNQAISDLPELAIDDGDEVQKAGYRIDKQDRNLKHFVCRRPFPMRNSGKLIYNHRSRYNNDLDLELFSILGEGENGLDVIQKHRRNDLMRYRKDAFHDKYYKLIGNLPSRTIVSHLGNDGNGYIHPKQARTLTPRECARLQSFPDDYVFVGAASSQWRQIGNAVPPLLAFAIAKSVHEHLKRFFH